MGWGLGERLDLLFDRGDSDTTWIVTINEALTGFWME